MFSNSLERETSTSPADELFYKGKLLPLHLPPRLEMVEKLLQHSNSYDCETEKFEDCLSTPLATPTINTPTSNTPYRSCNVSPSLSCQVSRELNPDGYFCECSTEVGSFFDEKPKKSWTRRLKLIKQSSLGLKVKASQAYLKCLFNKSGCSDKSCKTAARNVEEVSVSKTKECLDHHNKKVAKKIPFGQIQRNRHPSPTTVDRSFNQEKINADCGDQQRRSFSGAIKWFSTSKISSSSSSSSCSSNSNECRESQPLRRSSSANSNNEYSIQGAIAHCKKSQQWFHSRKAEVALCSLSPSTVVGKDHERSGLCRNCEIIRER